MPFQGSLWGTLLPDNATLDAANQSAWNAEVVRQSKLSSPWLNAQTWTAEHIIVPAGQPLVPVTCGSGDSHLNQALAEGVPIPSGTVPTNDSDSALTIWQPSSGKYWELQAAHQNSSGAWSCNFGGRAGGVNSATRLPHYVNYVTGPAGTYEASSWGTQGSGLPYWPGVISKEDLRRGRINHALLLEVYDARAGGHVWPASRGDGGAGSTNPAYSILEGQRARLAPGYQTPAGADSLEAMIVDAWSRYGLIITDRTLSGLSMRAAPSCGLGNRSLNLPWQDLKLLAVGSDTTQTPVS